MLPCQTGCPSYREGCHKTCPQWRLFQEKQRAQRQAKKQYLQFYNALCAQVVPPVQGHRVPPHSLVRTGPRPVSQSFPCILPGTATGQGSLRLFTAS